MENNYFSFESYYSQWMAQHQRHGIVELCVAKQYRAVNELFSQLTNEMQAITLISPSFPTQGWNFTSTNNKSSLSSHTAKGGMSSQKQSDFASSSPPIFLFMPYHPCRKLLAAFLWLDFQGLQNSILSATLVVTGSMCQRNYEEH